MLNGSVCLSVGQKQLQQLEIKKKLKLDEFYILQTNMGQNRIQLILVIAKPQIKDCIIDSPFHMTLKVESNRVWHKTIILLPNLVHI